MNYWPGPIGSVLMEENETPAHILFLLYFQTFGHRIDVLVQSCFLMPLVFGCWSAILIKLFIKRIYMLWAQKHARLFFFLWPCVYTHIMWKYENKYLTLMNIFELCEWKCIYFFSVYSFLHSNIRREMFTIDILATIHINTCHHLFKKWAPLYV